MGAFPRICCPRTDGEKYSSAVEMNDDSLKEMFNTQFL